MSLGVFVIGSDALIISPLLKDILESFHVAIDESGLAVSIYGLVIGIAAPALGADLTFSDALLWSAPLGWGAVQCAAVTITITVVAALSKSLRGSVVSLSPSAARLVTSTGSALRGSVFEKFDYRAVSLVCTVSSIVATFIYFRCWQTL